MISLLLPFGRLADALGEKRCITLSWLLSPAALLGFALSEGAVLSFSLFALDGVAWSLRQPAMASLLARLSPPKRYGAAFGLTDLVRSGAGVPSPALGGVIWERTAPINLFYGYCIVMALAASVLQGVREP